MLKLDLEYVQKILFIRLEGTITRRYSYKINNYIVPVIKKHDIKNIVFNLEKVKGIDESGVDAILNVKCTIKRNEGKIYLCNVNNEILSKIKRLHIKIISSEETLLN